MAIRTRKVAVNDLDLGMFVSKLDVPWASTPFPLQGFYIDTQDDIVKLQQLCQYVLVDEVKSYLKISLPKNHTPYVDTSSGSLKITTVPTQQKIKQRGYIGSAGAKLKHGQQVYEIIKPVHQEIKTAKKLHVQLNDSIQDIQNCMDSGKSLDTKNIRRITSKVVESMVRNPDALTWISRIRAKDNYTFKHTLRCCIWSISFGRYLGLPRDDLENLAMAVTLSATGKAKLPEFLLNDNLTDEQQIIFQQHIEYSIDILQNMPDISPKILTIVESFCERHNGTGYPKQLSGRRIPFLGRIAGIVDYYDTLVYPRVSQNAYSSADAISHLYKLRDSLFHGEMVEAFIQAIGVYPTGSLVELSTGDIALILEQKRDKRLQPKVAIILDENKKQYIKMQIVDLQNNPKDKHGDVLRIVGSLKASAFSLDLDALHGKIYEKLMGWF